MKRTFLLFVLFVFALGIVSTQAQDEERLNIVASYSILADVVANVAGDAADVTSLVPVGADGHTYEPTPRDLTAVVDADVVFVNGAGFEEGVLASLEELDENVNTVVASSCIEILAFTDGAHDHGDEEGEHEEGEEHEHEEGEEHADEMGEEHEHEEGEEHADEMGEMSAIAMMCAAHHDEMAAIHEEGHEHEEGEEHEHEEGEEHADEEGEEHEHEEGEEHEHNHGHSHDRREPLGMLYQLEECSEGHEHEGEEHSEEEGDEHDHEHDHGACDSHVWMEPHNAMFWTMLIRDTLVEMDPANAETYTANADAYLRDLDALAHDFVRPMTETVPEENRVLVTNHEFLGYFTDRYGFELVGVVIPGGTTAGEPSAADLAALIDTIQDEGVSAIFSETSVSADISEQIAADTGAQVVTLFSGTLSDADGPAATYMDYIRYNVTTIVEALGGGM